MFPNASYDFSLDEKSLSYLKLQEGPIAAFSLFSTISRYISPVLGARFGGKGFFLKDVGNSKDKGADGILGVACDAKGV